MVGFKKEKRQSTNEQSNTSDKGKEIICRLADNQQDNKRYKQMAMIGTEFTKVKDMGNMLLQNTFGHFWATLGYFGASLTQNI